MDTQQSTKDPKTPKIVQEEFSPAVNIFQNSHIPGINPPNNADRDNNDVLQDTINTGNTNVMTPLAINIPTFEGINMLPTPMTYTPVSPNMLASMSPTLQHQQQPFQQLNIKKRRNTKDPKSNYNEIRNSRELDQLRNYGGTNRIVSELIPLPSLSSQRVVSLPAVVEEELNKKDIEETTKLEKGKQEFRGEKDILFGYLLNNLAEQHQWKKIRHIGTGNFSYVTLYESIDLSDPVLRQVAVKNIKYPDNILNSNDDTLARLESSLTRELSILKTLNHPCVVKLYGINNPIFIENKRPLTNLLQKHAEKIPPCELIMSYCHGGDLLKELTECQGNLDNWLVQRLFSELTLAVKYLHENLIIHRDLKLENILLKYSIDEIVSMRDSPIFYKQNLIELGDFGLSKKIEPEELCTARCGSEDYVSPEILMGIPYDGHLTDTWALGVILYALLEDRLPFDPPPNANQRQKNRPVSHRIARFEWRWHKLTEDKYLDNCKDIVKNTLTRKNQRWNINDIYNTNFIQDIVTNLEF